MRPIRVTQNPAAQSSTVIAGSQSPAGAGNLTLAAGATAIDSAIGGRLIGITSGGNDAGITFTVTGLDQNGLAATEVITGAAGAPGTAVSTLFYSSISQIHVSGASAGTVTVGTVNTTLSTSSKVIPINHYARVAAEVSVQITGTINFTIKETFDPILSGNPTASAAVLVSPSAFASKTGNVNGQLDVGVTGVVVVINSYSTGATLTANIIQPLNSW